MSTLILYSHTFYQDSKHNRALLESIRTENVLVHNLNATYPDGQIDIQREIKLLEEAKKIVAQFPLFWFSSPSLFKEWQDRVLTDIYHSDNPKMLQGKTFQIVTTAGGLEKNYDTWGDEKSSGIEKALFPIYKTFEHVGAEAKKPFVVYDIRNTPLPFDAYRQYLLG